VVVVTKVIIMIKTVMACSATEQVNAEIGTQILTFATHF